MLIPIAVLQYLMELHLPNTLAFTCQYFCFDTAGTKRTETQLGLTNGKDYAQDCFPETHAVCLHLGLHKN